MKIQGQSQVLGLPVVDSDGRSLGRIVAVDCAPQDPYTAVWFVLRLRGWRRGPRAVPTEHARWHIDGGLQVPLRREVLLASPTPTGVGLDTRSRLAIANYYPRMPAAA